MEVEQAIERLEHQSLIQPGSTFIQAAAKTSNSLKNTATRQMR
jgi:hypothetical protein